MEEEIGRIIHYYDKISVAVVKLSAELKAGDQIHVKGKTSDFEQTADSIEVDRKSVDAGKNGDEVAIKLEGKAKEGDAVYRKS